MVESDIRYYQRRAREEMIAADRAVTDAARNRRLQLVDMFMERLASLKAPSPFGEHEAVAARPVSAANDQQSAFGWRRAD